MEAESVRELARLALPLVEAGALGSARVLGFVLVFPFFSWIGAQGILQGAIAFALGVPVTVAAFEQMSAVAGQGIPAWLLLSLSAKELFIGASLGLVMGLPFWAAEVAGGYADYYRGASMAVHGSPRGDSQMLVTGSALQMALLAVFVVGGGLRSVLTVIYESYGVWGLFETAPSLSQPIGPFITTLLSEVFLLAVAIVAPLLIVMMLVEAALAFSSRLAPKMNVFDTTLSAKSLAMLIVLPLYFFAFTRLYPASFPDPADLARRIWTEPSAAQGGEAEP